MLCYQHGSKSNAYQSHLMCPKRSLCWAGLHPSTLHFLAPKDLLFLSKRDYSKLLKMVGRCEGVVAKELKVMMHVGYKAEMQALSDQKLADAVFA